MASPEAWTYRTAFNLASSWGRRRSAERRANRRSLPAEDEAVVPDTPAIEAVKAAVGALPPKQRAAVVCRFYLAMTVAETAELLGCAEGTVKSSTHQALATLRASGLVDEHAPRPEEVRTDERTSCSPKPPSRRTRRPVVLALAAAGPTTWAGSRPRSRPMATRPPAPTRSRSGASTGEHERAGAPPRGHDEDERRPRPRGRLLRDRGDHVGPRRRRVDRRPDRGVRGRARRDHA